jgi:hypothetical protein
VDRSTDEDPEPGLGAYENDAAQEEAEPPEPEPVAGELVDEPEPSTPVGELDSIDREAAWAELLALPWDDLDEAWAVQRFMDWHGRYEALFEPIAEGDRAERIAGRHSQVAR